MLAKPLELLSLFREPGRLCLRTRTISRCSIPRSVTGRWPAPTRSSSSRRNLTLDDPRRPRGKKWTFMRTTRGSNFHDGEEFPAQSGAKQGSLKRRGSGFVSTGPPSVRLPKSPRGKPFPMTIEFRCAKVRRFPAVPRNRRRLDGNLFPRLPAGTFRRTATQPLRYAATDVLEGPENPF